YMPSSGDSSKVTHLSSLTLIVHAPFRFPITDADTAALGALAVHELVARTVTPVAEHQVATCRNPGFVFLAALLVAVHPGARLTEVPRDIAVHVARRPGHGLPGASGQPVPVVSVNHDHGVVRRCLEIAHHPLPSSIEPPPVVSSRSGRRCWAEFPAGGRSRDRKSVV